MGCFGCLQLQKSGRFVTLNDCSDENEVWASHLFQALTLLVSVTYYIAFRILMYNANTILTHTSNIFLCQTLHSDCQVKGTREHWLRQLTLHDSEYISMH